MSTSRLSNVKVRTGQTDRQTVAIERITQPQTVNVLNRPRDGYRGQYALLALADTHRTDFEFICITPVFFCIVSLFEACFPALRRVTIFSQADTDLR